MLTNQTMGSKSEIKIQKKVYKVISSLNKIRLNKKLPQPIRNQVIRKLQAIYQVLYAISQCTLLFQKAFIKQKLVNKSIKHR